VQDCTVVYGDEEEKQLQKYLGWQKGIESRCFEKAKIRRKGFNVRDGMPGCHAIRCEKDQLFVTVDG
jgi:hypothetical protein